MSAAPNDIELFIEVSDEKLISKWAKNVTKDWYYQYFSYLGHFKKFYDDDDATITQKTQKVFNIASAAGDTTLYYCTLYTQFHYKQH